MPNFWIQYLIGWTNNGIRLWTDFWSTPGTISFLWSVYLPLSSRKKTPISSIGLTIFFVSLLPQCLVKLSISLLLRTGLLTSKFFLSYFSFKMQSMQVALYAITSVLLDLKFAYNWKECLYQQFFGCFQKNWICQHLCYCIQRHLQTLHFKVEITQKDFEVNNLAKNSWAILTELNPPNLYLLRFQYLISIDTEK